MNLILRMAYFSENSEHKIPQKLLQMLPKIFHAVRWTKWERHKVWRSQCLNFVILRTLLKPADVYDQTHTSLWCLFPLFVPYLTLILLTWRIWWAPNNTSKWQMGFNPTSEGLTTLSAIHNRLHVAKNDILIRSNEVTNVAGSGRGQV
jgi:hypothetical protein